MCAYRQPPNLRRMLVNCSLSRIPTLVGISKYMKPRCHVCDMLDTRKKYKFRVQVLPFHLETTIVILVTLSIYSCVANVTGNYIGETLNKLRFRLNNHKKSIRDNSRAFPEAVHFNQPDHSLKSLTCDILRDGFKTTAVRLICERMFIHKLKTHSQGVNQNLSFLSPYNYLHLC